MPKQKDKFFTKQEAQEKVGKIIQSLIDFSVVPKGTTGTVSRSDGDKDNWTVAIQWHLPTKKQSVTPGQIGDESFLFVPTNNPLVDWFSKSEYEKFLKEHDL